MQEGLADVSFYRGGYARYGSMVWADMEEHRTEGSHLPNVYQIFGHTQQLFAPVIESTFANLDCRQAFLLLEDGGLFLMLRQQWMGQQNILYR